LSKEISVEFKKAIEAEGDFKGVALDPGYRTRQFASALK
jgi:hypothetical protein